MSIPNLAEFSRARAQLRAVRIQMGKPYNTMPKRTVVAALAKHGGLYTLLDQDLMAARMAAMSAAKAKNSKDKKPAEKKMLTVDAAGKLRAMVQNFFYKLVNKDGYLIHSELMAYISEPGKGNGVSFDNGVDPSPSIPAAFTFVGQFIDHDLTLNGMNLTENENGIVVQDKASPLIDLDNVYGALLKDAVPDRNPDGTVDRKSEKFKGFKKVFDKIFHKDGTFKHRKVGKGFDLPREEDEAGNFQAVIFDPRNDENQLILQVHILVQRFHNALIESKVLGALPDDPIDLVERVRLEVVATWQHFVLCEYMPAIIKKEVLKDIIEQINIKAADADHPEKQYGNLKHKPYKDLVRGTNVVRMPHEFAIGFRFGHSQLRPFYILNEGTAVILFKDARQSAEILIDGVPKPYHKISGKDDLKGSRKLTHEHVINWDIFYPKLDTPNTEPDDNKQSMRIDHKVTARVFNLPESAIPDDIKYIGNLAHRNLIRSSQIGIVSGEELAHFYGLDHKTEILKPKDILGGDAHNPDAAALFTKDSKPEDKIKFKTPLWYYLLKEAEIHSDIFPDNTPSGKNKNQLGIVGSRLVGEVLAGALYYGNDFPIDNEWVSVLHKDNPKPVNFGGITIKDCFTLHEIIDFAVKYSTK